MQSKGSFMFLSDTSDERPSNVSLSGNSEQPSLLYLLSGFGALRIVLEDEADTFFHATQLQCGVPDLRSSQKIWNDLLYSTIY